MILKMGEDYPEFGKLIDIYDVDSTVVHFQVQPLDTHEFNELFNCYLVQRSNTSERCVPCTSLFSFLPRRVTVLPGSTGTLCVAPRHYCVSP